MQFSENQKYYLKRFAALHMPEIGRKAAYVRQELKTTWMAVDSTSVPDGVVYVYHNKEYKHIEDIVADVLDIHGDSAKIMQINNSRLACGLPTFVTWEKAETLYTIPGDKEKREIVTCMDYLSVYGINPDEVYAMQVKKSWMTTGVSFDPEASMESGDRTVALPFDENSDMGTYFDVLQNLGNMLLAEDRKNIHCSITYSVHNIDTLFSIWRDKPGLEMSVGYAEYHVDGTYFPGDYLLTVKASGAINEFGKEQYKAKATLFYENMIVDSVDYPFGNDRLTSITTSPNAVDNWANAANVTVTGASPAGKNGAAPEQGISTVPAGGNGAAPATTPTPETAPTAKGQGNVPSANVNTVGEDNTAPAGTAGTTTTKATAPVLSNAGTLPTEPTTSGSETAVAPGTQAQNVSAKLAPGSEPQSESEISAGGNGAAREGNTVVIASPAQGGNVPQTKDAAPSGHVKMGTSADSSVTSTVTQSAGEDSVTNSSAAQTETVVDGTGTFSESSVGSAMQSATDKTVTEEGHAPTTTPASPDSSDFAANDSTVSVESPAGSAPGEEFAGPAEQTTSYGSADAEFGGSNTPSDIGVVNENAGSTGSETQLMDDGSDAVQTHAPAQFESATGAAVNDSVTDDASADYAEPPADAGNGAVTENSGSTDSETQFANDSSAAVQTHTPASQTDNAATNDNVSDDASVDYAEPPANADNASGGSAAPVVQHTDNEPAVGESDDSDTSSGYVGGTEDVGSADVDASPMDGDSATVETQAPASYADRTVDTDDEAAGNAGPDYAEPPADAGGASNDVAAPSAQRTDSDDVSGEGNTGFAGGNGGGDNYSSDEETAPTAQGVKAPADEDDSGIGEPPAKGESSSNVGAVAGHAAPSADGDGDDFDDNDVGSASFGGSNGSSHDENPGSDASSGSGEETSNDDATAPTVQHQNVGNNSHDDGSSSDDNDGTTVSAPSAPAPEIQGGGAVSSESAGSDNDGSAGQTAPAASVTENTAPAKATSKATAEASRAEDNPAPAAQNFNHGGVGEDTGDSGDADGSAARKQPAEKPPVDGTQFYADTSRSNSFTEAGTSSDNAGVSSAEPNTSGASNGPEIRPLSHLSIKAFNDTNGFVESDGIGRIQVTRVSVDPDTGITQWRIMQKLDADGNVPETPDVMNIERSAKYNKQTRRYEPETFESIARQLGKVDDYESVGPDTDESYKRRSQNPKQVKPQSNVRSDVQPQQKNAYEGKSFRERNTRNERNERNNRFQQMMQGNKSHNGSKNKKDKPSK